MKSFIRIHLSIILIILACGNIFSQTDTLNYSIDADSAGYSEQQSKHILYAASGIGSTPLFPGPAINQNQKFGYTALLYGYKNEFYISASGFKMMNNDLLSDFFSYSVNYTHGFGKWFDISMTAARFQFLNNSEDPIMNNFIYSDVTAGLNFRFLSTKISWSGLFSSENQNYYQLKNSGYFQTRSFFKEKAFLSFNPYVSLLFGTHFKSGTTITVTPLTLYDTIAINNPVIQPGTDSNGSRTYSAPSGSTINSSIIINSSTTYTSTEETTYSKVFGLMEINLGLPVAINFRNFTFEAETGYVFPAYSDDLLPRTNGFVFLFSAYFKILK